MHDNVAADGRCIAQQRPGRHFAHVPAEASTFQAHVCYASSRANHQQRTTRACMQQT